MESWPEVCVKGAESLLLDMPGVRTRDIHADDQWSQHLKAWSEHLPVYHPDWANTVVLKPPRRFRDYRPVYWSGNHGDETVKSAYAEKERKVVEILQNILRELENEIQEEQRLQKERKRLKQQERRQRREARLKAKMDAPPSPKSRHAFTIAPDKPLGVLNENRNDSFVSLGNQRDKSKHVKRQGSFNIVGTSNTPRELDRYDRFGYMNKNRLDRKIPKRAGSYGAYDWSRHSRGTDDDTSESDVTMSLDLNSLKDSDKVDKSGSINAPEGDENNVVKNSCQSSQSEVPIHTNSPRLFGIHSNNTSFDSDISQDIPTPTTMRRKLKSFDILPNYKKNTSDSVAFIKSGQNKSDSPRESMNKIRTEQSGQLGRGPENSPRTDGSGNCASPYKEMLKNKINTKSSNESSMSDTTQTPVAPSRVKKKTSDVRGHVQNNVVAGTPSTAASVPERTLSTGTSGYSTDETSNKVTIHLLQMLII
ncbi:hypothetical protein ACF0H5_019234 [Mactra antiquata]